MHTAPGAVGGGPHHSSTVDGTSIHTNLVLEPGTPPPSGFVENTSTTSTVELTVEVAFRLATPTVSVSCVGAGLSCPAEGTGGRVPEPSRDLRGSPFRDAHDVRADAVFEGTLSGQPYGIPDSSVVFSLYDGAPPVP